jgi:hypothetical protein
MSQLKSTATTNPTIDYGNNVGALFAFDITCVDKAEAEAVIAILEPVWDKAMDSLNATILTVIRGRKAGVA